MQLLDESEIGMVSGGNWAISTAAGIIAQEFYEKLKEGVELVSQGIAFPGSVNGVNGITYDQMGNVIAPVETQDGDS